MTDDDEIARHYPELYAEAIKAVEGQFDALDLIEELGTVPGERRLARFVRAVEGGTEPDADDIATIAAAFRAYLEAHGVAQQDRKAALFRDLELNMRQGRPKSTDIRNPKIAAAVGRVAELRVLEGFTHEKAMEEVCLEQGLSENTLRNYWAAEGKAVLKTLQAVKPAIQATRDTPKK